MRSRPIIRCLCVVLALCTLLCSCQSEEPRETWAIDELFTPLPSLVFDQSGAAVAGEPVQVAADADSDLVPFDQMEYYRPNLAGMKDRLGALADAVLACREKPGAAPVLLNDAARVWDNYATALNLAMIHNSIDTTDVYWQEEYAACLAMRSELATSMGAVLGAAQAISEQTEQEEQKVLVDSAMLNTLQTQESSLVNEYQNILNTATVDVGGTAVAYADNMSYDAYRAWTQTYAPQLGNIYVELVRVRNQIARLFGYDNYIDYSLEGTGFSSVLLSSLLESLRQYLAPLIQNGYSDPAIDMDIPIENAIVMMRSILPRIDSGLGESLNVMEAYQLSSLSDVPQKAPGAFTGYIKDYGAPFICMRYDASYDSFSTLIHEFGHFNDLYVNSAASLEAPETSEIFSTALVLLLTNYYGEMFGPETGAACLRAEFMDLLLTSLSQGAYLSIEMQVYSLPDEALSYEQVCAIAAEAHRSMGFTVTDLDPISWVEIMRLFDSPFYVLSYIVSNDVAVQLWEISQTDPALASAKYNELLQGSQEEKAFLPNVLDCGLTSPFEGGEVARQAQILASQLGL